MNLLIGIFQVFWLQFHLATARAAIFKDTSFSQNTFNSCYRYTLFSCSMIQKTKREPIKLETVCFLHCRCLRDQNKHKVVWQICPKFWETHPKLSYAPVEGTNFKIVSKICGKISIENSTWRNSFLVKLRFLRSWNFTELCFFRRSKILTKNFQTR